MTRNQLEFQNQAELRRANREKEAETRRANMAKEALTADNLSEVKRHNKSEEDQRRREYHANLVFGKQGALNSFTDITKIF